MEMHQLICDNLGMTRDMSISSLSKGEDGSTNYAFENHNIRILAVNDNTKFSVTNEKSTSYEGSINGIFLGGCTCGRYLVLFIKDTTSSTTPDYIYRLEYTGIQVTIYELYKGNLGFTLDNPIEAIGYYDSAEVQKVYWVDGLNKNRMINITKMDGFDSSKIDDVVLEKEYVYFVNGNKYYYKSSKNLEYTLGNAATTLYALCDATGRLRYYTYNATSPFAEGAKVWLSRDVAAARSMSVPFGTFILQATRYQLTRISPNYNDYSFDFQGHIENIPTITITKNYSKAGTFQAGVLQYFITYYNKYGVETCLVWNSDLQYISLQDRGAKADEAVSCAFDFTITSIDENYDYLRIYAAYRSGINGKVSSRIVADISLIGHDKNDTILFTDLGNAGTNFNAEDIPYIGGQDIRANTLDYKQDTLFLGDIFTPDSAGVSKELSEGIANKRVDVTLGNNEGFSSNVTIQDASAISWVYKYVSPVATTGLYSYTPEIHKSQEDVAGFKYRELYRFGIQFMDEDGTWTTPVWLGDKYCSLPPRSFSGSDFTSTPQSGVTYLISEYYHNTTGERYTSAEVSANPNLMANCTPVVTTVAYEQEGCYIANAVLDWNQLSSLSSYLAGFIAYRLLVVETDIVNRRIVTQGVINPTMFNYADRYYNRPYAIPSWIFRPRLSQVTHRHYDTLPIQTAPNAELQGIMKKQVPGFVASTVDNAPYDSYMFIIAANEASIWSGFIQWKLIYYNSGSNGYQDNGRDNPQADLLKLAMFTGKKSDGNDGEANLDWDNSDDKEVLEDIAEILIAYQCPIKPFKSAPGEGIVGYSTYPHNKSDLAKYLVKDNNTLRTEPYVPVSVYGNHYRIVSGHIYSNKQVGTTNPKSWGELRSNLIEKLTYDMEHTTAEEVGAELAGKIVLSGAMLPTDEQIKKIARDGASATEIAMAIMAVLVAAAAIIISALTFGATSAIGYVCTQIAISAAVSVCAASAIGMASAAAYIDLDRIGDGIAKEMLVLGYYSANTSKSSASLSSRQERSRAIAEFLEKYFTPVGYIDNSIINVAGTQMADWKIPVLTGEDSTFNDDEGNVPFTTKHNYTEKGRIGQDYNAYITTGRLTSLSEEETDLKKKQNLFCVDESIVTLNSPDVEDISYTVDNSDTLRLDLVGIIPIDASYGTYGLSTESGLNSNSQVLQGRYVSNPIEKCTSVAGILNGYLYQDFKPENIDAVFTTEEHKVQVTEATAPYKIFMWNKRIAGFWFPGITLQSPIDAEENILEAKGKILNKVFANLKYSTRSLFYPTKTMEIETPVTCLDAEVMTKTFKFGFDTKNYYENVDTISVNEDYYTLVENNLNVPANEDAIVAGKLKDPVHIRYKETPHIILPIKNNTNITTILPYTDSEKLAKPEDYYSEEDLHGIKLPGIEAHVDTDATYIYVTNSSWSATGLIDESAIRPFLPSIGGGHSSQASQFVAVKYLNSKKAKGWILYNSTNGGHYYIIRPFNNSISSISIATNWISTEAFTLAENTGILYSNILYYATKNANLGAISLIGITDIIQDLCTTEPNSSTWRQDKLTWRNPDKPYLFLGELVKKVFDYNTWNGGTSEKAMEQLTWNVASKVTPIGDSIDKTWGDTFYQRWDCEKTYPFTEEDVNSNVEVLSFMLESHKNLDGRCDTNRGIHNLLNTRPSNTIYNNVYGQADNFFTYQMLDTKFSKEHFEADVVWSLTKNNLDDIDKWTCLLATNEMSLDGRYGAVRKILNVNDVLIAFQDTAIANIKYNEAAALNTTSGLPLQMGNTGKVDGYRMISDTIGCHNKFSISKNSAGVFFADDYNKTFNQFTANTGIADIGMRANFSQWFKQHLNGGIWTAANRAPFRVSYDEVTHDLYIISNNTDGQGCLIYNTLLQKFTSFMDYIDTPMIARLISNSNGTDTFAIRSVVNNSVVEIWKMFAGASTSSIYGSQGAYGYIYGAFKPYSMEYRLNPDPMHDSIFTNYQYTADWMDPAKEVDSENVFGDDPTTSPIRRYTTFDIVEAKNEYQQGIMAIQQNGNIAGNTTGLRRVFGRQPIKNMFRIWRGDIPRDKDTLTGHIPMSDRMRNPWIHLKFKKITADDSKMTFYNLMVNYYNQYGRI